MTQKAELLALAERADRCVKALREPDYTLARTPNTIRQSIADVIEELLSAARASHTEPSPSEITLPVAFRRTQRFTGSVVYDTDPIFKSDFNEKHWLEEPLYAALRTQAASACWLVEWPEDDNVPVRWWNPTHGWMRDANKALRFAREIDAADYISSIRTVVGVKPTEHIFVNAIASLIAGSAQVDEWEPTPPQLTEGIKWIDFDISLPPEQEKKQLLFAIKKMRLASPAVSATNSAPAADRDSSGSSQQHSVELESAGVGAHAYAASAWCPKCGGNDALGYAHLKSCTTTPPPTPLREALIAAREWIASNTSGENDLDSVMGERGWWDRDTELMDKIDKALSTPSDPFTTKVVELANKVNANAALAASEGVGSTDGGSLPERETWWLAERFGHGQYAADRSELPGLTNDPWRAVRFKTERETFDFILRLKSLRDEMRQTEHVFINKFPLSTVSSPNGGDA